MIVDSKPNGLDIGRSLGRKKEIATVLEWKDLPIQNDLLYHLRGWFRVNACSGLPYAYIQVDEGGATDFDTEILYGYNGVADHVAYASTSAFVLSPKVITAGRDSIFLIDAKIWNTLKYDGGTVEKTRMVANVGFEDLDGGHQGSSQATGKYAHTYAINSVRVGVAGTVTVAEGDMELFVL